VETCLKNKVKTKTLGMCGCVSLIECFPSMHKIADSVLSTTNKKINNNARCQWFTPEIRRLAVGSQPGKIVS
jgi:hypothetical protein